MTSFVSNRLTGVLKAAGSGIQGTMRRVWNSRAVQYPVEVTRTATYAVHRNAWYSAPQTIVDTRLLLLELQKILSSPSSINEENFNSDIRELRETYDSMMRDISKYESYYVLTDDEKNYLKEFRDKLKEVNIETHIKNPQILSGFKLNLGRVLAIAEKWGESRGPVAHLKKRSSRAGYRLFHRQTDAERQTELLIKRLQNEDQQNEDQAVKTVEFLVRNLDRVINARSSEGIGSHNARELSRLLLCQANLEEWLGKQESRDVSELKSIAEQAPLDLVMRGYRPNLTLQEPPAIIEETSNTIANASTDSTQVPLACQQLQNLLTIYSGIDRDILLPLETIANKNASNITREDLQLAQEIVFALGSQELGWFRNHRPLNAQRHTTISFQSDYLPAQQIVDISAALEKFKGLRLEERRNNSADFVAELGKFLGWLRDPEQSNLFTAYFKAKVQELEQQIRDGNYELGDNSSFELVRNRLNYWSRPSLLNRMLSDHEVSPSLSSFAMASLSKANCTGQELLKSFDSFEDAVVVKKISEFVQKLDSLVSEYHSGTLPNLDQYQMGVLISELNQLKEALQIANWPDAGGTREQVIQRAKKLLSTLTHITQINTSRSAPTRATEQSTLTTHPSFRAEFHELLTRLEGLNQAIEKKNPEEILEGTRSVWSFSAAILAQEGGSQALVRHYGIPARTLATFERFAQMLKTAIDQHPRNRTCDPKSPRFVFSEFQVENTRKPILTELEMLRREMFLLFQSWKTTPSVKQWALTKAIGEAPKQPETPPSALLQQAFEFYVRSLSDPEVLTQAKRVAPLLRSLPTTQNKRLRSSLLQLSPNPSPDAIQAAREALPTVYQLLREQEDREKSEQLALQERDRPLESRGLVGQVINGTMNVASKLGILPEESPIRNTLEHVANSAIGTISQVVHRTAQSNDDTPLSTSPTRHRNARSRKENEASLFRLQEETEEAVNFNIVAPPAKVSDEELTKEKDLFVHNNTSFVTMYLIREYVCRCSPENTDYYGEMIQKARAAGPTKEYSILKESFLAELQKAGVGSALSALVSWFLFPFIYYLTETYLKLFADRGLAWMKDFIERTANDPSHTIANRAIDRVNGFLATLQSAYRRIGDNPNITGTLDSELEKELSKPEFNHGMTQDQLHQSFAHKIVEGLIEPGFLQWSQNLREKAKTVETPVLHSGSIVLSWIATLAIYPLELILRKLLLNLFVKRYVVNGKLASTLLGAGVGSIKQNGYTHALNCVLHDQLKDIYLTLQRHCSVGDTHRDTSEEDVNLGKYNIVERAKLSTLVHELFNVLQKHNCKSPEELRRLLHNNSIIKKVKEEAENQLNSRLVKTIEELLGAILHSVLKKDQLETQFHQLLITVNNLYQKGQSIPESEFQKKEDAINRMIDAILMLVIDQGVSEIADLDKEHEQKKVNSLAQELLGFAESLNKDLNRLFKRLERKNRRNGTGILPPTINTQEDLHEMLDKANQFLHHLIEWRTRIESSESSLSSKGKEKLLEMEANLRDQVHEMVQALNSIYTPRVKMSLSERVSDLIGQFKEILNSILGKILGEEEGETSGEIKELETILRTIKIQPALAKNVPILQEEIEKLKQLIEKKNKEKKPSEDEQDDEPNLEFPRIAQEIKTRCHTVLNRCTFENTSPPDDAWKQVKQGMLQLSKWIENPPKITLEKDTSIFRPLKEKAIEIGKGYVIDRIRDKSNGILSLIRNPTIWKHGIEHLAIHPLVE